MNQKFSNYNEKPNPQNRMCKQMSTCMNNPLYDVCTYRTKIKDYENSLGYNFYRGKYENIRGVNNRLCDIVDVESELKNMTRPLSKCPEYNHKPQNNNYPVQYQFTKYY